MRRPNADVCADPTGTVSSPVRVALVTAPDVETAEALGRAVVEEGLAACANVLPGVTSVYRWQGEVRRDAEALIILKTTDARAGELTRRVVQMHPYDVPEVLILETMGGYTPYLDWVRDVTGSGSGGGS
jgi:periplasmic divalent cation tolerance protein